FRKWGFGISLRSVQSGSGKFIGVTNLPPNVSTGARLRDAARTLARTANRSEWLTVIDTAPPILTRSY
ncbi:hypothetical protein, partial [Nocardia sp. NPDC057272]|uniref:hypothetical protein n=1 Tax=Nocardia sp. NPDC057272 TaxID=3346079 RepID=UPI00364418C0